MIVILCITYLRELRRKVDVKVIIITINLIQFIYIIVIFKDSNSSNNNPLHSKKDELQNLNAESEEDTLFIAEVYRDPYGGKHL